jgi:hypothetical protein
VISFAREAGIGKQLVVQAISDIGAVAPRALEKVLAELPTGFPEGIAGSISVGFKARCVSSPLLPHPTNGHRRARGSGPKSAGTGSGFTPEN